MYKIKYIVTGYKTSHWFENNMPYGIEQNFLLISKSNIKVLINGELQLYPANTAFFFPKNTSFYYCTCENEPYEDCFIQFDNIGSTLTEKLLPPSHPISLQDPEHIYDLINVMAYENIYDSNHREEILDQLMNVLVLKIHNSIHSDDKSIHFVELQKIRQQIYEHPEYDWSLDIIADSLNMTPNHVHSIYKKSFNTTCNQDVITSRINAAKHQLIHTSNPVYLIASSIGYNDAEHFHRQFKKNVGISPLQYRKTHKNCPYKDL